MLCKHEGLEREGPTTAQTCNKPGFLKATTISTHRSIYGSKNWKHFLLCPYHKMNV